MSEHEKNPPEDSQHSKDALLVQLEILKKKLQDPALAGENFNALRTMVAEIEKNFS